MTVSGSFGRFRQGIYAFGPFENRSMIPIISPEMGSATMQPIVFGQPKTYSDNIAFDDLGKFDPVSYINDADSTQSYPVILGNVNLRDPSQMDGVLEPLGIRAKITMTSIDFPYESHDIWGSMQSGNEDFFRKSDIIMQFYTAKITPSLIPFIDSDEYFGSSDSLSVKLPGIVPDNEKNVVPFSEQDAIEYDKLGTTLTGADMISALEKMNPATEDLLPNNHRAAGGGFTYDNNVEGTDSLAFGGLKK